MGIDEIDAALSAPDDYERMFALPGRMDSLLRWLDGTMKREHQWDARNGIGTVTSASLGRRPRDAPLSRHPRGWPGLAHRHDFVELMYVHSGRINHVVDGRETVLEAGDFCLLTPRALHSFAAPGTGDILISARFDHEVLAAAAPDGDPRSANASVLRPERDSWVLLTMRRLLFEHYVQRRKDPLAIRMLALLLIHDVLSSLSPRTADGTAGSREEERLLEVLLYITSNPATANLAGAAAMLRVTPSHLSRCISRYAGTSFTELVRRQRFQEAKRLVQETAQPIESILSLVGYSNRTYFYKEFRERFSVTPGQARMMARGR
jgi:AraC-like DNA-binding protein/mannose-6-phosphate isomerase-like protein (cupin superfamily)